MKFIRNKRKIKIGMFDLILSYLSLVFIIGIPWLIFTIPLIYRLLNGNAIRFEFAVASLILTIVVVVIIYSVPKKLKLTKICEVEYEDFCTRTINCFNDLNWPYTQISEFEFTASTSVSWYSWGERIYIVYLDNKAFINSMGKTSPLTFGKDSENVELFKDAFMSIPELKRIDEP